MGPGRVQETKAGLKAGLVPGLGAQPLSGGRGRARAITLITKEITTEALCRECDLIKQMKRIHLNIT